VDNDQAAALENRRIEYTALRAEILQADNICLLMMGYLITSVGILYTAKQEWLISFLCLVALCYFTDKRFSIRNIASFISNEICRDNSGFSWEKHVQILRGKNQLRPFTALRPYNTELLTCSLAALSPLVSGMDLLNPKPTTVFWGICTLATIVLAIKNYSAYSRR
jgi:hypothetical protein